MADLIIKIDGDLKEYKGKLKEVGNESSKLQSALGFAAKGGAIAFAGLSAAIGVAVNEAAKFETITTQFEVLTGSAGKAKQVVEDLQKFAASTPFQFDGIAKTAQQLLAFGFTAEEMPDKLKRIGDVAAATGKPMTDLGQIFGQVSAAGKLTGERFNQLQEAGIPMGKVLAESMGVAESAVRDLVSRGEVDFATFEEAFNSLSEEGGIAFGAMEKRSKTLEGKISTLKDNVGLLANSLGQRLLPIIKPIIDQMIEFIQTTNKTGEAVEFFSDALTGTLKVAAFIKAGFKDLGDIIGITLAGALEAANAAINLNFSQAKEIIKMGASDVASSIKENHETLNEELAAIEQSAHEAKIEKKIEHNEEEKATEEEIAAEKIAREEEAAKKKAEREAAREAERRAKQDEKYKEELARLKEQGTIEKEALRELELKKAKDRRDAQKQYIKDEEQFGKSIAMIKKMQRSAEYQGAKQGFGELAQLQQSENKTLKSIGKGAAIASIIIKTAESAMNIYAGFSAIPFVGQVLGVAGAAAAVAFGAEQVSKVASANEGGMIGGNMLSANRDSVLSYLTPGEFVTPRDNYNETIEAVADRRLREREEGGASGEIGVMVSYDTDEAEKIMTVQQNEAQFLGTSRSIAS